MDVVQPSRMRAIRVGGLGRKISKSHGATNSAPSTDAPDSAKAVRLRCRANSPGAVGTVSPRFASLIACDPKTSAMPATAQRR